MISSLQSIFNNMQGDWVSQQTVYYLSNKQKSINTFKISVTPFDRSIETSSVEKSYNARYLYLYNNNLKQEISYEHNGLHNTLLTSGIIKKKYKKFIKKYSFFLNTQNTLKIKNIQKDIQYEESIYHINENFKVSVVMIKKMQQYLAICFTSSIKIMKN